MTLKKGDRTRSDILAAAMGIFADRGYAAATMSDLCDATGLSRGGLYRYFASTREVFLAMLEEDKDEWEQHMLTAMAEGVSAAQMMTFYLARMKAGMMAGDGRISLAAYEFARSAEGGEAFAHKRYEAACAMMARLLDYGCGRGEFHVPEVEQTARRFVIFVDGLRIAAAVLKLDEKTVDWQLNGLLDGIRKIKKQ